MNPKKSTQVHQNGISKDKVLKTAREKWHITYERTRIYGSRFLIWNLGDQKEEAQQFSSAESKELSTGILYLSKLHLKNEEEIKNS